MNLTFLCIIVTHIKIWHTVDASAKRKFEDALIFNTELEKLDDVNSVEGQTNCLPCITACLAESDEDINFNNEFSLGKKSLFLKKVYDKSNLPGDVETKVCKKFYGPTVLFDIASFTYETGYELYYKKGSVNNLKYDEHSYDDFRTITEVPEDFPQGMPSRKIKIFKSDDGREMVFYWVSVLSIKFNPSKYQIQARFRSDVINDIRDRTIGKCFDYDLGYALYQSESAKNVKFFISSMENRQDLFDVMYIPPQIRPEPQGKPPKNYIEPESPFLQSYGNFERAHLVPLMFLHSGAAKLASCTFLNAIPVWSSIYEGQLKLIDEYLYTIFRMWSPKVNIIFGVSDITKIKVTKSWKLEKGFYEDNNDQETDEISFPKLIYRIVEYGVPGKMAYKVIVIHNDRIASRKDMICNDTSDDWSAIRNSDPRTGLSYACRLLPDVNEKLGAYEELSSYNKSLQLDQMNTAGSGEFLQFPDQRENIKNEMKKLFPDRKLPTVEIKPNTYEDDFSSSAEPEPRLELGYQSQPNTKVEPGPEPQRELEPAYEFPADGKIWILPIKENNK